MIRFNSWSAGTRRRLARSSFLVTAAGILYVKPVATRAESNKKDTDDKGDSTQTVFDLSKEWERAKNAAKEGPEFLRRFIITKDETKPKLPPIESNNSGTSDETFTLPDLLKELFPGKNDIDPLTTEHEEEEEANFFSLARAVSSILMSNDNAKEEQLQNLIRQARQSVDRGDIKDSTSYREMLTIMQDTQLQMSKIMDNTFGHLDLSQLFPTSLFYFVERDDELKNPSWKNMKHRFHPGVDIEQVNTLNDALYLAELSYADSLTDIQEGLKLAKEPVELLYCDTESIPGRPSHFLLLKKEQSLWSSSLEVIMVVRGTKTITDAITDCLLEARDYRGGKAHAGILDSGRYLVEKHLDLLLRLRELSKKRKIKLTLIGHSLGAGAASIAGIELNDIPEIDAQVIGFGCPALLSKELSENCAHFITTVIGDADIVPRMSGASVANVLLDIMEYDWIPKARRDMEHALEELRRVSPGLVSQSNVDYVLSLVDSTLATLASPTLKKPTTERMERVLFPPGTCIHFYRDGSGITGKKSPCTFFDEIDISRTMINDHLISSGYRQIFLDLMRQYRRDQHFRFEDEQKK